MCIDGKILEWIIKGEKKWDGADWINLAEEREQWWDLVNTII